MHDKLTLNQEYLLIYATIRTEIDVKHILFSFEKEYYLYNKEEIKELLNLYKTTLKEPYTFNIINYETTKFKHLNLNSAWVVSDSETNKIYKYLDKDDVIKYKQILLHIKQQTEFLISHFRDIVEVQIKIKSNLINYLYLNPHFLATNKFKIDIIINDIKNLYPNSSYLFDCEYRMINPNKDDVESLKTKVLNRTFINDALNTKLATDDSEWFKEFMNQIKINDEIILGEEPTEDISCTLNIDSLNLSVVKKAAKDILEMNIPLNTSKEDLLDLVFDKLNIVKN